MKKNMLLKIALLPVFPLLVMAAPLAADLSSDLDTVGDGGYPAAFMYGLGGAKAMGAGYAWNVLGVDPTAVFFNPSALVRMESSGVALSANVLAQDRVQGSGVFALRNQQKDGSIGVWAFSAAWSTINDVNRYTDNTGTAAGTLDNSAFFGQVTYASSFSPTAQAGGWGVTLRGIGENYDGSKGTGFAIAAGADFSVFNILRFGFALDNLGLMNYTDDGTIWQKPFFSAALAFRLPSVPASFVLQADKVLGTEQNVTVRIATEFTVFSIRPNPDDLQMRRAYEAMKNGQAGDLGDPAGDAYGLELVLRIGLVEGDLFGGLSLRWNWAELSYAAGMDPLDGEARHSVSVNFYL